MKTLFTIALFPIQVGKSFCFKMAFRFLHRKNRNAAKRFGKKGWSLRRGKRTFPKKGFFPSSSNNLYWEQSLFLLPRLPYLFRCLLPAGLNK